MHHPAHYQDYDSNYAPPRVLEWDSFAKCDYVNEEIA
eukprot:CAMPEP_0172321406 /NCGR_PEP_ID=MMETSP1058-20130122/43280_1 /TAXON_ID=83371 /ORGANISM="Detonula confervacea, Strain CCMP 353" /LENGTH=36 /DNA_ID= /DNA_START= /DNA_END= /DNA_ORIENTATION=